MVHREEREAEAERLEGEIAEVCGVINAATGRLVSLIAAVLATASWEGWGIRSPEHWVAWRCGVSRGRARRLVSMARRLGELPETKQALEAGELTEDQVAVVCRHIPARVDAEAATLARSATVTQLQRALSKYSFEEPVRPEPASPGAAPAVAHEEPRRVGFGYTDEGSWRLSALLPADEGARWERALTGAREALVRGGDDDATWADAFVAMAAGGSDGAGRGDRSTVLLHVETMGDHPGAHLHLGPAVDDGLRRFLTCDARVRTVLHHGGLPVSVGRAFRTVPQRTRIVVEDRDGGCRVPGCPRTKWLHVHHMEHWESGGATDTPNLIALCSKHHRLHHLGRLGVTGNADDPDGVTFTDHRGRLLTPIGEPRPPGPTTDTPEGNWRHPPGERFSYRWLHFDERKRPWSA